MITSVNVCLVESIDQDNFGTGTKKREFYVVIKVIMLNKRELFR